MTWQWIHQNAGRLAVVVAGHRWKFTGLILLVGGLLVFRQQFLGLIDFIGELVGWLQPNPRIVLIVGLAVAFLLVIWLVPRWQVGSIYRLPKDRFQQVNEARKTLAQILGGLAFLGGLYFTSETLRTTQEGQVTDRFTKAITQLGDDKLELRLGGIYALERIARDSEKDYWPVMEILTAYVRERSPRKDIAGKEDGNPATHQPGGVAREEEQPPKLPTDVQAVLTILGRRTVFPTEDRFLDLRGADLRGADFQNARLDWAVFERSDLRGADLRHAVLTPADLRGADLRKAKLQFIVLRGASFEGADLRGADLAIADLRGAYLEGADLQQANLQGAYLQGVDLRNVKNLTKEQVADARTDENTKLPDYLKPPQPKMP